MNKAPLQLNRMSIFISGLCILHCIFVPTLMLYIPTLTIFEHTELIHYFIVFINIAVSLYTYMKSRKRIKHSDAPKILFTGYAFYLCGLFLDAYLAHQVLDTLFVLGSCFLVLGHLINHRNCCSE